jgi:glycosyltransferase involved in cell wall biosynthesis
MSIEKRPKVSVLMITYNHERFIEQAVRSVMMQKANFDWELVIGEDCSTDRTREIIEQLVKEFSGRGSIRLLANEQNLGVGANFRRTYEACLGEYIAFLEGDDYWTAEEKLQLQADFLDAHPDVSLCFHPMIRYSEAEQRIVGLGSTGKPGKQFYDFMDVLDATVCPHTGTLMVRREHLRLPTTIVSITYVDRVVQLLCAERGRFGYIDRPMSVYRQHSGGVNFGASQLVAMYDDYRLYNYLNDRYCGKYAEKFDLKRRRLYLALFHSQHSQFRKARRTAWNALTAKDSSCLSPRERVMALGLALAPRGVILIGGIRNQFKHLKTFLLKVCS